MLLNPHVRICAGGGPQGPSLPRPAHHQSLASYYLTTTLHLSAGHEQPYPLGWSIGILLSQFMEPIAYDDLSFIPDSALACHAV
jgi:hypothetical protein